MFYTLRPMNSNDLVIYYYSRLLCVCLKCVCSKRTTKENIEKVLHFIVKEKLQIVLPQSLTIEGNSKRCFD